jgi:hypothetical protein
VTGWIDRQLAVAATKRAFARREIDWREVDCARMLAFHLVQMGHAPPPLPKYSTAKGAARELKKAGGLAPALDGFLERIPALLMWPGDVAILPGENGMDAVIIWAGRKGIGWHEDSPVLANMTPDLSLVTAWRA